MKTIRIISVLVGMFCMQFPAFAAHWSCNASAYRYDMLAYINLTVNGSAVTDFSEYEVAAFCGNECRGVASFSITNGSAIGTLRIRSNNTGGENISFKAYKASIGKELVLSQTMDFVSDTRQGLPSSPIVLTYNFVTGISINPRNIVLLPAGTAQLSANITPSNANSKEVTWTTDNASVATVSTSGLVTAHSGGNASITCKAEDGSGKTAITQVHVHTLQAVAALSPTCTTAGNLAYWYCQDCKKYYSDAAATTETSLKAATLAAIGHAYAKPVWNWAKDGKSATATFTCANDSKHTETIKAIVTSAIKIPATCTEMGTTTYTANVTFLDKNYSTIKDVQDIPATDHAYGEPVWQWSKDGKSATATFTCANDNKHTETLEATITSAIKIPATCTEMGTTTYSANVTFLDKSYTATMDIQDIEAMGHDWEAPEWSWAEDGSSASAFFTCKRDSSHIMSIAAEISSAIKTPATCTESGTTLYTAIVFLEGESYTSTKEIQDIEALGHSFGEPTWNWAEDGKMSTATFTCANDNEHTETLEALVTSIIKTPATCTENGITTYTATVTFDEKAYTSTMDVQDINAIGHDYDTPEWLWAEDGSTAKAFFTCKRDASHIQALVAEVTSIEKHPATCTERGTTLYTATVILEGETYTSTKEIQNIESLRHEYVYSDNGDGMHTVSCSRCDMESYCEVHECEEGVCIYCHACPVTNMMLSADSVSLEAGDSITLTVTITPEGATNKQIKWSSSDESVVTVTDGIVTAIGEGTATITAVACDGSGVMAECTVVVTLDSSISTLVCPDNAPAYTLQGLRANRHTKGVVIMNGKKYLKKP